jgi:hypothetical protein
MDDGSELGRHGKYIRGARVVLATGLGNPFGIPRNSVIDPIPGLLNSRIFIGILFFQS